MPARRDLGQQIAFEAPALGVVAGVTAGVLILFADLGIFAGA
ncbi:MAG TPA: hypothetical protein VK932_10140 [Kofleriaceae bacterium]|nr:hypothetical protein [Kofleriaceae bacterium]